MSPRLPIPHPLLWPASFPKEGSAWLRRGATALATLAAMTLGAAIGLALTAAAIRSDAIGTVRAGPWRVFTDAGSPAVNPYVRARLARLGSIPLAAAQGLTATARADSAGAPLEARCRYRVGGTAPMAQFWTLEAAGTSGQPFSNAAERHAFTSADVLRDVSGRFMIALSPEAEPGNWLPLPGAGRFMLVLRLYDTGLLGGGSAGIREAAWPSIETLGCD